MRQDELKQERERLQKRLDWLGLRSTGSEKIERRIEELNRMIRITSRKGSRSDFNIDGG